MKKRKATLCLALAAVFGISSVAGCSKTPNNSGQDEKAAESQAGSTVGGADGSGDGSGSSGESTAIKEAGPDPNASVFAGEEWFDPVSYTHLFAYLAPNRRSDYSISSGIL